MTYNTTQHESYCVWDECKNVGKHPMQNDNALVCDTHVTCVACGGMLNVWYYDNDKHILWNDYDNWINMSQCTKCGNCYNDALLGNNPNMMVIPHNGYIDDGFVMCCVLCDNSPTYINIETHMAHHM